MQGSANSGLFVPGSLVGRLLIALALCALAFGCDSEPEPVDISGATGEPEVREIRLFTPPAESPSPSAFPSGQSATIYDLVRHLHAIEEADSARGVFLRVGPMGGAYGRAHDIIETADRIRTAGKSIHCQFEVADNVSYLVMARICDRISMTPAGSLDLVGVAAHLFYARTLLANAGVRAEMLHMGRYKGAGDTFTLDAMPEETREAMGEVVDGLYESIVSSLVEGREMTRERAIEVIDAGPYTAERAREAGLVDDVGFDDEAREHARVQSGVDAVRSIRLTDEPDEIGITDLLSALAGDVERDVVEGDRIAIAHLSGQIRDGQSGNPSSTSGPFVRAIRRMADDDEIKAVVLRIDSPGGSALASDRMWHAVTRLAKRKPVIASIGDMAASGGYYVASAANTIVAHETSLVGSIGVVGGKFSLQDLASRAGVNVHLLSRGRNAAWSTPMRDFSDSERDAMQEQLRAVYYRFIRRVSAGRGIPQETVLLAAEGRVMTGARGKTLQLVDDFGGLDHAIAIARERANLAESPVEIWPGEQGLLEMISSNVDEDPEALAQASVRRFVMSLSPLGDVPLLSPDLFAEEHVLVALPYAVTLH